jgi:triacylglycerol esterase/lipase EstA (alpha/beta hydrolase family)
LARPATLGDVDSVRRGRYVPPVLLRIVASLMALVVSGSLLFVVASYTHAFWHRHRHHSAPLPVAKLMRAALFELGAILLLSAFWPLWWLVGASYEVATEGEGQAAGRRHPVILLHGFAMNRTNWIWLGRRLAARGIGPLYGTSYFSLQPIRHSAAKLARFVEEVRAKEQCERVDIVAHSLGGVVARWYIDQLGGADKVGRVVTIGSPHRGTATSRLGPFIPSAKETRAGSDFYAALGPLTERAGLSYTSVWSRADAIIEPPESSSIAPAGADCVFDDLGHLSLLLSPRVLDAVAERLCA